MEDRLKKIVELWCLCGIMVFRRVNKQPGKQKFWNWCSHYQEIYDWISPLNKQSGSPWGKMSMVNLVTCLFSLFWSSLNDVFEAQIFSGLHFYTLPKPPIACRAMHPGFLKVKTLLNDAFKAKYNFGNKWKLKISLINGFCL